MFKWIVATCAALYVVLLVFGSEDRRPEVARSDAGPLFDFNFSDWIPRDVDPAGAALSPSAIDEVEAVRVALEAGRLHRSGASGGDSLRGLVAAVETAPASPDASASYWYVSGTLVNLRSGPGTSNAVVAQLERGDPAEVISDPAAEWIEIRAAGGAIQGWISSRFLSETQPG